MIRRIVYLALVFAFGANAQERDVSALAVAMEARVEASLQKYRELQETIAAEKVPIVQQINAFENESIEMRARIRAMRSSEDESKEKLRSSQSLARDLRTQNDYVSGLFAQYLNTFEGRLHISEDQRFDVKLTPLRDAIEV
ncbi:MAG: hypothetical protein HOJ89_04700, partial [Opitutales bacterium]|nr:hypothetical protein [Opitutales bacterium]